MPVDKRDGGLVKFVVDGATDLLLGCYIAGPIAGNLAHEVVGRDGGQSDVP